jgi:hypothetical protein
MSITFNHEANSFHESLGVNREEFAKKIADTIREFFNETKHPTCSKLSELLYERMSDAELLLLASNEVLRKLDEMEDDVAMMEKMFKNLFNAN